MEYQKGKYLPDFLVIGPQKAGTTWIYRYLLSRGDVCLPDGVKETFFFDRSFYRTLKWYNKHFTPGKNHIFIAEVGPTYFQSMEAAERIKKTLGTIPLVCTLRDPADRAFSHYLHMRRYGMTRLGLHEAVKKHSEILESSCYASHLKRWHDTFEKENVHIVFQETLAKSPEQYTIELCNKIGLSEKPVPEKLKTRVNVATLPPNPLLATIGQHAADFIRYMGFYGIIEWAKTKGLKNVFFGKPGEVPVEKLESKDRHWLIEQLLPEIEELEHILDKDLSSWKIVEKS
ncbi:MAG: sulfotransferase domain-containing protein [Desulfobacteraceae bacterium]|nr:sulfotransferase domain-containing protein [Desulfobacteraceae bacterium]